MSTEVIRCQSPSALFAVCLLSREIRGQSVWIKGVMEGRDALLGSLTSVLRWDLEGYAILPILSDLFDVRSQIAGTSAPQRKMTAEEILTFCASHIPSPGTLSPSATLLFSLYHSSTSSIRKAIWIVWSGYVGCGSG